MQIWQFWFYFACLSVLGKTAHIELGSIPNIWEFGQKMDLYIYASDEALQTSFNDDELIATLKSAEFGESIKKIEFETKLKVSAKENPLFLHLHLMKTGIHPDPMKSPFDPLNGIYKRFQLLKTMKRPPKRVNLLEKGAPLTSEKTDKDDLVPYWYPDVTVNLINYDGLLDVSTIPLFSRRFIFTDRIRKKYYPIIYFNEFWELKKKRIPILDEEVHEMPLKISFSTTSLLLFKLMTQFDFAIKQQEQIYGEHNEFEGIKKMFLETSPWLIALTFFVSILHSLFDFLAFKNDVQFWRKQKDMTGLSVRGILINSVFQFIIFFYLLDSETSWIVLFSVGIGAIIELWKLTRVFEIKWTKVKYLPFLYLPYFQDRISYIKSQTREHDNTALKYLTIAVIPLMIGYSLWSLKNREHKSWYSWILKSLVGFVYSFGFISMTPQLFINYKLKSVAHMPWKAFVYKALNTFIDDLFAFVIKMPWMHRIACFRDDILFFIYLYQMWIYPVDMKRANEFGQVFEKEANGNSGAKIKENKNLEDTEAENSENMTLSDQTKTRKRVIIT